MSYQQITALGNLGKDPELRFTQAGKAVCNFSLAVNEGTRDKPQTTWFTVVVWEKAAEACGEYLAKGSQVLVIGRMQVRTWKDKNDVEQRSWELVAREVKFLGGKTDKPPAKQQSKPSQNAGYDYGPPPSNDDLPF